MDRRIFLHGLIGSGLLTTSTVTTKAMARKNAPYDLSNLNDLLECEVKLRGSLDERMVISWIRATQYAVVDTIVTPLYHLLNASFQQFKRIDENGFAITMLELAYFTDLETGAPLTEFTNPFTNETGRVPPSVFGPNHVSLTTDGLRPPEFFPFGTLSFEGKLGPGYTDGEEVWVREDTLVKMISDNPAFGNYIYNELVTYRGNWAEVNDPNTPSASAHISYNTTSNWRPWMMAGDTPGHIMSEGYGKKVSSIDDLPTDYLQLARKLDPEVIGDPETILTAPPPKPPTG